MYVEINSLEKLTKTDVILLRNQKVKNGKSNFQMQQNKK